MPDIKVSGIPILTYGALHEFNTVSCSCAN